MRKSYNFLLLISLTCFNVVADESKDINYYKTLANLPLCEIVKKEDENITTQFLKSTKRKIEQNVFLKTLNKIKNNEHSTDDILMLLEISNIISDENKMDSTFKQNKWVNPLSYSICIAAIDTALYRIYDFSIGYLYNNGSDEYIKIFSDEIKRRLLIKSSPYYFNLVIKCDLNEYENNFLLNEFVKRKKYEMLGMLNLNLEQKNKIKKSLDTTDLYEYRALYGDKTAEILLLQIADTIKSFEGNVDIAKKLAIANTQTTIMKLIQFLEDTSKQTPTVGVEYFLRNEIFQILNSVFDTVDIFNSKYRRATGQDLKETATGKHNVNKYFNEVSDWVKEKYNIDLHNLRKDSCFLKGYSIPIRSW